jgi:hypothetical protein
MPCYDPDYSREIAVDDAYQRGINYQKRKTEVVEAILCQTLKTIIRLNLFSTVLDNFNYKEADITKKQLLSWWEEHKKKDARKRAK